FKRNSRCNPVVRLEQKQPPTKRRRQCACTERKGKMKNKITNSRTAALAAALLALAAAAPAMAQGNHGNPSVLSPKSRPGGKTYGEWSIAWWQWALGLPPAGHPFIDSPDFDVTE